MRTLPTVALITLLCVPATLAGQAWDENWKKCTSSDPAARIAGCSALIQGNKETKDGLATVYMNRGTAYTTGGDYDRAIQDYNQSLQLNPNDADAFYNRGYAYGGKGQDEQALNDLDQALKLKPDYPLVFQIRGSIYLRQGDYERALHDFDELVRLTPNDPLSFDYRGNAYDTKGDYDRALQDLDQAVKLGPKNTGPLLDRGLIYVHKRDFDHAIQDYDQALKLNPNLEPVFARRGYAYYRKGDLDKAIHDFDEAIRLDPKDGGVFDDRANAYDDKGDFDKSLKDYAEALRLDPKDSVTFVDRGLAYGRKGDYDRALQDFNQALQLNPDFYSAFMDRGDAYGQKGDYDHAIEDYNQALRVDPKSTDAMASRGSAFFAKNEYDRAIQDYDAALRLDPKSADILTSRGDAYMGKKDTERALQDYDQALLLNPKQVAALTSRSQAYISLGRYATAVPDLETALQADPGYPYYSLWLYVARTRAGQDGRAELEKNAAKLKLAEWPGSAVNLFLGKTTPAAVLAAANNPDAKKNREQHCEAYYYLAEYALMKGNTAEARGLFQQSVDTGVTNFIEFANAQVELQRIPSAGPQVAEVKRGLVAEPVAPVKVALPNGKYYALVIGINQYPAPMHPLATAVNDARAIAKDLTELYGFQVTLLLDGDATRDRILEAIEHYQETLNENDSLIIYYAGHGYAIHNADKSYDKAYWLPADANSTGSIRRIISDDLTTDIRDLPARHVLIISDSCYAGGLLREGTTIVPDANQGAYLSKMMADRSRTLMASGGDEPVSDSGSGGHSVFAAVVLRSLERFDRDVFTANQLFVDEVQPRVAGNADQTPQYGFIKNSSHDNGDFVFVRKGVAEQAR